MGRHSFGLGIAAAALFGVTSVARADAPPSVAELQSMLDDGKYAAAVSGATRVLGLKGAAAAGVDAAAVYAIKGEAQLHLKAYPVAADSFAAAAKAAADPAAVAEDKATELLARRAKNGVYTPKQPAVGGAAQPPIDVTDKAKRKDAFAALFADEYAADAAKLKAAETSKDVTTALAAVDLAVGLRALEVAATGADEKVKAELTVVADHAKGLIQTGLQTMTSRVADIKTAANATTSYYDKTNNPRSTTGYNSIRRYKKTGLTSQNTAELKQIVTTCEKIGPAADALSKATAGDGGGDTSAWDKLSADAGRTAQQANDVATADYGNGLNNTQK